MYDFIMEHPVIFSVLVVSSLIVILFFSTKNSRRSKNLSKFEAALKKQSSSQSYISNLERYESFKKRDRDASKREKCIEEKENQLSEREKQISSTVTERLASSASKVRSRPYFSDTEVFLSLSEPGAISDNTRLISAFTENMSFSYPLSVQTQVVGKSGTYTVTLNDCTCEDFRRRGQPCKHMYRLALDLGVFLSISDEETTKFIDSYRDLKQSTEAALSSDKKVLRSIQQKQDYIREKEAGLRSIISDAEQSAPWLSRQFADFFNLLDLRIENELRSHPNVTTSGETVKQIRMEKRSLQKENKLLTYQLNFYESLFPWLPEFKELSVQDAASVVLEASKADVDPDEKELLRKWLSPDDYKHLPDVEKYQLVLDRWPHRKRTNWEAGIDYERYIGYRYETQGYRVEYIGATLKLEDMGRDLIASKGNDVLIIQCKRYSADKPVRENTVFQLYGSMVTYQIEHEDKTVSAAIYTSSSLSDTAQKCAEHLSIGVFSGIPLVQYPLIKCNIGKDGKHIYHLPFDQQYDKVVISPDSGEQYATTVAEAEALGFRRAFRFHGLHAK